MPMVAVMAKPPFDNSAANLFFSNLRSGESEYEARSTPGAAREVVQDEHADDSLQGQAAAHQLGCQHFPLERAPRRVRVQGSVDPWRCPSGRP